MSTKNGIHKRKQKNCSIGLVDNIQQYGEFKKPFPIDKISKEKKSQKPFEVQKGKLLPRQNYRLKENKPPSNSLNLPTKTRLDTDYFCSFPSLLSPIKSTRKMFLKPISKSESKKRLIDPELKNMIDIFAKNIENLANGSRTYKEMKCYEINDRQELTVGQKRLRNQHLSSWPKREKLIKLEKL